MTATELFNLADSEPGRSWLFLCNLSPRHPESPWFWTTKELRRWKERRRDQERIPQTYWEAGRFLGPENPLIVREKALEARECARASAQSFLMADWERAARSLAMAEKGLASAAQLTLAGPAEKGAEYSSRQAERGKRRWQSSSRPLVRDLIGKLAKRTDELGDPMAPSELWPEAFAHLDRAGLEPVDEGERYTLANGDTLTKEAFRKAVQEARK